jgi:hypothetical protein
VVMDMRLPFGLLIRGSIWVVACNHL